jgi:hypothetical protein
MVKCRVCDCSGDVRAGLRSNEEKNVACVGLVQKLPLADDVVLPGFGKSIGTFVLLKAATLIDMLLEILLPHRALLLRWRLEIKHSVATLQVKIEAARVLFNRFDSAAEKIKVENAQWNFRLLVFIPSELLVDERKMTILPVLEQSWGVLLNVAADLDHELIRGRHIVVSGCDLLIVHCDLLAVMQYFCNSIVSFLEVAVVVPKGLFLIAILFLGLRIFTAFHFSIFKI